MWARRKRVILTFCTGGDELTRINGQLDKNVLPLMATDIAHICNQAYHLYQSQTVTLTFDLWLPTWCTSNTNMCSKFENNPSSEFEVTLFTSLIPKAVQMELHKNSKFLKFDRKRIYVIQPAISNFMDSTLNVPNHCYDLDLWPMTMKS